MTSGTKSGHGHVWRWHDEDPEAIIILVLIIVAIVALPWKGCGPASTQGDPHPVVEVATPADLPVRQAAPDPGPEAVRDVDAEVPDRAPEVIQVAPVRRAAPGHEGHDHD